MKNPNEKRLPKHHYIPVFYLRQWVGGDGRLCEFSRKYKNVKPRRTSPDGTGYVRGLYRLPNVPEEKADVVETAYLKLVDNGAALALQVLVDQDAGPAALSDRSKVHWARFLHCMILRSPEYLAGLGAVLARDITGSVEKHRANYDQLRTDSDPPTFDEFKSKFIANPLNTSAARIINRLVDSETIVGHLRSMPWHVVAFDKSPHLLLTSDRPVIMTNGIRVPNGHIAIPISPRQIFLAFNDETGYRAVRSMAPRELIATSNTRIVEQARNYVYGLSDASLGFVSTRLGKRIPATPLETGVLRLAASWKT